MEDTDREKAEKDTQSFAALGVAFVCIFIGIPLWWKTTEVYRVSLPDGNIAELADTTISYRADFTIVLYEDKWDKIQLAHAGEKLKEELKGTGEKDLKVIYQGNIRHAYEEEKSALQSAASLSALDEELEKYLTKAFGRYYIHVLPKTFPLERQNGLIGTKRSAFIHAEDVESLLPLVQHIMRDLIIDEVALSRIYHTAVASNRLKTDKESMRGLRYHPGYDVTFTLLNPQPDILDARWNIREAVEKYVQPLIKAFEEFSTITVKSQYLYYTNLSIRPRKSPTGNFYILRQDGLPHIINPIEAHLSSHVSTNPHLNFIVYIPSRDQSPLHILDESGERADVDAFLSPRWGGMLIYNVPSPEGENITLPVDTPIDPRPAMEVFLSQLRLLVGVTKTVSIMGVGLRQPGNAIVSQWGNTLPFTSTRGNLTYIWLKLPGLSASVTSCRLKEYYLNAGDISVVKLLGKGEKLLYYCVEKELDKWLRNRALENVATATTTLKSLTQLLNEVSNIVINDDIGSEVQRAVTSIEQCHANLYAGKLREAFATSRQAIISSEKAFFDPSLLELLYFPEDQKFAIYIPLFLPVSIPVLLSLYQAIRWFRQRRKVTSSKAN